MRRGAMIYLCNFLSKIHKLVFDVIIQQMMTPMRRTHVHNQTVCWEHNETDMQKRTKVDKQDNQPGREMQTVISLMPIESTRSCTVLNCKSSLGETDI